MIPTPTVNTMEEAKRKRLEAAGWHFGNAADFLDLTPEENTLVEIKLALSRSIKTTRQNRAMTQMELANRIQSSQSRISQAEKGDVSVSLELMIYAMLAMGATPEEIGQVIAQVV